jgi:predicted P-loop ATPase
MMIKWIAVMIKYGKTQQCWILQGGKGVGKSFFWKCLSKLIVQDYFFLDKNGSRTTSRFNAHAANRLLIVLEELPSSNREHRNFIETLKTLITEDTSELELKYKDVVLLEKWKIEVRLKSTCSRC